MIEYVSCLLRRVFLNMHEFIEYDSIMRAMKGDCGLSLPLWVLWLGELSDLALLIYSGSNLAIYSLMSKDFR